AARRPARAARGSGARAGAPHRAGGERRRARGRGPHGATRRPPRRGARAARRRARAHGQHRCALERPQGARLPAHAGLAAAHHAAAPHQGARGEPHGRHPAGRAGTRRGSRRARRRGAGGSARGRGSRRRANPGEAPAPTPRRAPASWSRRRAGASRSAREVHFAPVTFDVSGPPDALRVVLRLMSAPGEEIALDFHAAGPVRAEFGGLTDPLGHAPDVLPLLYRDASTVASPATTIAIDGHPYAIPVRVQFPGFTGVDAYYTEGFPVGV